MDFSTQAQQETTPTTKDDGDAEVNTEEVNYPQRSEPDQPWFKSEPAWKCTDPLQYPPREVDGDPWEQCRQIVDDHDRGMCDAWKDEIQSLLIFAGLFSAVVTGFVLESIKLLQDDSSNLSAQLLARISAQLEGLSINSSSSTSDAPLAALSIPKPFTVTASALRVNSLWTVSLTLSLTTVLVGILCLQWLREYQKSDSTVRPQEAIGIRQVRYTALTKWRVPFIVSSLPLLLQSALVLFLIGLIDLVWFTNHIVAIPLAVFVGLTLITLLGTTISPAICDLVHLLQYRNDLESVSPPCPYKSPQSWAFSQVVYAILKTSFRVLHRFGMERTYFSYVSVELFDVSNRTQYDRWWQKRCSVDEANGLAWIANTFSHSTTAAHTIYQCVFGQHVEMIWKTSRLTTQYGKDLKSPLTLDYSAKHYTSFVRDLALFDLLSFLLPMGKSLDHWLLLHKLELFVRLKSSWISDDYYLNNFLPDIHVSCPSMLNYVEVKREPLPDIPDRLRIQLFNRLDMELQTRNSWWVAGARANRLMELLATIILSPPADLERNVPFICSGFTVLNRWLIKGQEEEEEPDAAMTQGAKVDSAAQSFYYHFLRALTTRFNEEKLVASIPQLLGSEPFLVFMDMISDTPSFRYADSTFWNRFIALCHLEDRYPRKEDRHSLQNNKTPVVED